MTLQSKVHIIGAIDSRTIIQRLEQAGWIHFRTTGSHHHFRPPDRPEVVTVPHPRKDVAIGTLKSIERKSGLKLR